MDQIKEGNFLIPLQDCCHLSTTDRTQNYISLKNYNIMPEIFNIGYAFKVSCLKIDLFCYFKYSYQITKKTPPKPSIYKSTI